MSSDTMYINSSRLIRTYSRNKMSSPIYSEERTMNKNKNKNKNRNGNGNRSKSKNNNSHRYVSNTKSGKKVNSQSISNDTVNGNSSDGKQNDFVIPELQLLPNGQKPDFGNYSSSSSEMANSNNHNYNYNHNHTHTHKHYTRERENNRRQSSGAARKGSVVMNDIEARTSHEHGHGHGHGQNRIPDYSNERDIMKLTETLKGYLLHGDNNKNSNSTATSIVENDDDGKGLSPRTLSARILNPGKAKNGKKIRRSSVEKVVIAECSPKHSDNNNNSNVVSPPASVVTPSTGTSLQTTCQMPLQTLHNISSLNSLQSPNVSQHQPMLMQPPIPVPVALGLTNTQPIMGLPAFANNNCPVPVPVPPPPPSMTYTPIPPQGLGYPFGLGNNVNHSLSTIPGVPPQQIPLMTPMFGPNRGKPASPTNPYLAVSASTSAVATPATVQQDHSGSTSSSPTSSTSSTSSNSSPPPDGLSLTSPNRLPINQAQLQTQVQTPRRHQKSSSGGIRFQNQSNHHGSYRKNHDRRHNHNYNVSSNYDHNHGYNSNNNTRMEITTAASAISTSTTSNGHSFAGASFAASIPEGSDLPKPSFL